MKRIQVKWLKIYNVLICAILGALGFTMSSCFTANEYGVPSATFIVHGKVTNSQNNQPIKDIQVDMGWNKVFTNADGKYEISIGDFPDNQIFPVRFQDVDGDLNGSYMDLDTIVEFKNPKFTGSDKHWYSGETTKEFNIQLNPKE
jgi:putative lipoprotein (rSAM/lipoprotein system)